jgi:hypothetical protein
VPRRASEVSIPGLAASGAGPAASAVDAKAAP